MARTAHPLRRTRVTAALSGLALLAIAGCGAKVEPTAAATQSGRIVNCGVERDVPRPKAPVAYDVSAIDKMLALGLADQMRGIVLPKTVARVATTSPYAKDYAKVKVIGKDVLGQEGIVDAKADWVFAGWQAGFSQERGITPESLKNLGIDSYLQEETCFNYDKRGQQKANLPGVPETGLSSIDATYRDLTNLGQIFGVQDRAKAVVAKMEEARAQLQARPKRAKTPAVFVYDSGTADPYTAGHRTAPQDIIQLAGGRNIAEKLDARWDVVGWESVVTANPDVVVVVDYDKEPLEDKLKYLRTQSPIKNSTAITKNRIHVIDYGEAVSGPRNMNAARQLADFLDKQGL